MLDKFRIITDQGNWLNEAKDLLEKKDFPPEFIEDFNTYWIEGGHRIREQLKDDAMLTKLLRAILPAYSGDKLKLYRGENIDRWEQNSIGLCWTSSIDKARMFGQGLNSIKKGGMLLSCVCEPQWIISKPNDHSIYLGEYQYTVDPFMLTGLEILERYTPHG